MGLLQREMDQVIKDWGNSDELKVEVIKRAIERRGLKVSAKHLAQIQTAVENADSREHIKLEIESEEDIALSDADAESALEDVLADIESRTEKMVETSIRDLVPQILQSLYKSLPKALRNRHGIEKRFRRRLMGRWREGIDRLEMLIMIASESGNVHVSDIREQLAAVENQEDEKEVHLAEALARLHARACLIASEVVCLLKGGFADGAHTRWRSIYEIAIVAMFLRQKGGNLPQRYMDHTLIERCKSARKYQEYCEQLGYEPVSDEEMQEIEYSASAVTAKYGENFGKGDYGWAAEALGNSRPNFADIESAVDMAHWRPHYKVACRAVHAGPSALFTSLGCPDDDADFMLAGATNAGLADPGHCAAIALTAISAEFLTLLPTLDSLISGQCMAQVCDDAGSAFLHAHAELQEDMERLSASAQSAGESTKSCYQRAFSWIASFFTRAR